MRLGRAHAPSLWMSACLSLGGCSPAARPIPSSAPIEPATTGAIDDAGLRLLRDVTRAAEGAGARAPILLAYGAGTPGDRIESLVSFPDESCALLLARATESVEDLDLHVYGDDGSQFGIDESPDDLPTLLLCPEKAVRLFASARVAQGEGLVALGVQTVPRSQAPAVAQAVGARNFTQEQAPLDEPWPGLDQSLEQRRANLGGTFLDQRRVALPVDSRVPTHITLEVPAGRCLDALILPSVDVSGVQLTALDEDGRIFARGDELGPDRALLLCSRKEPKSVTLRLRPYAGRGVAVAAFSVSRNALSSLDPSPETGIFLVDEAQPPADLASLQKARSTTTWQLRRGELASMDLRLFGCSRIDLVTDEALQDFDARLYDEEGRLLGETSGRSGAPLFACIDGTARLDVEALGRSGSLTVEHRASTSNAPLLSKYPLAASRMLGRAHSVGRLSLPEDIGKVQMLSLDETSLARIPLSIPAAHCQTLFFGGDHGAWGLKARIVDPKSGLTLDQSIGRGSLEVHACAPQGGTLSALVEVQTTSGATSALWAARQERVPPK